MPEPTIQSDLSGLLNRYNKPIPRYTSFPTVPHWNFGSISDKSWKDSVGQTFKAENGEICLYIHLPFCEELCTYCACNKRITKNHAVETPYLESVLKEWNLYRALFSSPPKIREIHLGGGTPTFFSPENLKTLISSILSNSEPLSETDFSVEVHPNHTRYEHLEVLRNLGFNRISLGIQDFDPAVQFIIHREQSFEQTKKVVDWARELGYSSINVDLIYGLPRQTLDSIAFTMEKVGLLRPDRIAFYSYAHVPWKSKGQRRYTDDDVPKADEKIEMFITGTGLLKQLGYENIGMDHFALKEDPMFRAMKDGTLHRNFMGYTTTNSKLLIGLGASSISDSWEAMVQNEKTVELYQEKIEAGQLPLIDGHFLNRNEQSIRLKILDLMCGFKTTLSSDFNNDAYNSRVKNQLIELEKDGLIEFSNETVRVTDTGRIFIRNVAAAFDPFLMENQLE
ncbi:MAG TPA: oxygen-independent coproporphyrinogen III oxidase, partial [Catalimonadaceae bacterium]|nr:oxygen-independent coproporphyrinogen III oxidase [Catalimonadaceae bacterium]